MTSVKCTVCGSLRSKTSTIPCRCFTPAVSEFKQFTVSYDTLMFNSLIQVLNNIEQELINVNMNLMEIRRR